jgi:hypothetical protein
MKWMIIIVLASALSLNGCANTADAEDSTATTPAEQQEADKRSENASSDTTWIAIVMTWNPVNRVIDKEFSTEVACWDYYENGVGESKFGSQVLDHQNNPPTKDFNFGPNHLEYPIRTYRGINDAQGQVWLTCDIKGRYSGL